MTIIFAFLLTATAASATSGWHHRLSSTTVHHSQLSSLLGQIGSHHKFAIPEAQLRRGETSTCIERPSMHCDKHARRVGTAYVGSNHRLRAALKKAMSGERPLKIGVVGE